MNRVRVVPLPARLRVSLIGLLSALFVSAAVPSARADSIIRTPGAHPSYSIEVEPHLFFGVGGGLGSAVGPGVRGTIPLVHNGFVKTINNSVGLGFGLDLPLSHGHDAYTLVPLVMQWNFWLASHWSAFVEPGLQIAFGHDNAIHPSLSLGGRYHFNESVALTLRAGYPGVSVGASFLL